MAGPGLYSAVYFRKGHFVEGFPQDLSFALNSNGKYQALLVDKAADQKLDPQRRLAIYSGHFLSASPVVYVFAAAGRGMERRGGALVWIDVSTRMYVSTGGTAKLVGDDVLVDSASIRAIRSPRGTILTFGARKESTIVSLSIGADGKVTAAGKSADDEFEPHVLVVGDSGFALRPAPRIDVADSKETFLLSDVVGWINENEAIAIRDSGLFQLKKIR